MVFVSIEARKKPPRRQTGRAVENSQEARSRRARAETSFPSSQSFRACF